VAAEDLKPSEVSVKEIMRPVSACCGADDSFDETARKLNEHQTTSLPVIDQAGSCCGTVSFHHIPVNSHEQVSKATMT
jgi:CBS-domain-containing membrane protein